MVSRRASNSFQFCHLLAAKPRWTGAPGLIALIGGLCLLAAGCSTAGNAAAGPPTSGPSSSAPASSSPTAPLTSAPATTSASPAQPVPILGQSRGITEGYGSVRPSTLNNGGDPTGIVTDVLWASWGRPRAVGTGTAFYDPPNVPVAGATQEQATVVAFDLGTCEGQYMYQAIEWYVPESGGSFDATHYLNVCSWTYHNGTSP